MKLIPSAIHRRTATPCAHPRGYRYTEEERRDVCELIDQGWHPLDVAVAYGIGVYRMRSGGLNSTIRSSYTMWSAKFSLRALQDEISTKEDH